MHFHYLSVGQGILGLFFLAYAPTHLAFVTVGRVLSHVFVGFTSAFYN